MKKFSILLLILFLTACEKAPVENANELTAEDAGEAAVETPAASALPAGVTLVEAFAGDDGFSIPYRKYRLDNGLTVILHEDHSDPMAQVDVTFHVGSGREEPGRSGFAHFFEHMMFEGSAHVEPGEMSKIISNAGGGLNGTTDSDRTTYYESIPINQLEIALWLEADRMGLLLDSVSQEKFEIQRETVKNERGQRVDNVPYGRVSETLNKNLFPAGHPYSWPVIGWIEDLNAADVDDLKKFFLRWYGPNNAVLTIGGAIDPEQTLEWVAKYFGPIPSGPAVEDMPKQAAKLEADRYVTMEDNIHLPAIAIVIPTVHHYHEDEAAIDAAAKIIGQGRASLLYQRLVQTGRAVNVYVSHACRELSCEFVFIVIQNPSSGETLAEMEQAIRETLSEFAERGVTADDLQKFKAGIESGRIFGFQSVGGKVSSLAFFETFFGDPKIIVADLERYQTVTEDEVTAAFKKYVEDQPAVVLSIVPNGRTDLAAREQNFEAPEPGVAEKTLPTVSPPKPEEPPVQRPITDNFDRSKQPKPGTNPTVGLPPVWDAQLANGVRLLAVPNKETPTVTIQAVFEIGQRDEPPGKAGLAAMTAAMMHEATTQRTAAEFSEALERIGASVGVSAGQYETTVTVSTLDKYLDAAMALMMERMLEPAFLQEDFDRIKSQRMESLMQSRKSGPSLATRALSAVLAGPTHPLSYPRGGLPSTLAEITLDDVKAFYATHIPAHLSGVLVSTSLPQEDVLAALTGLAELEVTESFREAIDELPKTEGRVIYLVNKDEAAQSSLRIAHPSLTYDALGDYFRARLMNFTLGGTFDSRINLNLREDKGYSYGAYSRFNGGPELGLFRVSTEVNKEATIASINEVLTELENYSTEGMTEEEYEYMQSAIGQRDAMRYETPGAKLGLLSQAMRYDLPLDYRKRQNTVLRETDRETLNGLAGQLIDPQNIAIVVVGDAAVLRPELEAMGMPIKELDEDGFPLD